MTTAAAFMAAAPAPLSGSSPWAAAYAVEVRQIVREHAANSARTLQSHLGPSELGVECDRQVVGKLVGLPITNHVVDPWPSVIGTAVHAWLAEAFAGDNSRRGRLRWVPEQRVVPHPEHSGTADLYDAHKLAVVDHKVLGSTSLAKVRSPAGPPRKYVVQLLLYALGYRNLGLPVRRVALVAYPRTKSSLDGLYVWDREHTSADAELINEVFVQTDIRKEYAVLLNAGHISFRDVPAWPSDSECYFCPFYRPESARDDGTGCPGTVTPQ